jgi:hypothetical protein
MNATERRTMYEQIEQHGNNLLAIFPRATERDPVELCKKLRALERRAAAVALRLCNGPEYREGEADKICDQILKLVNTLLGNAREYQPKTGAKCSCRRGVERDNCPTCEGTGFVIDFAALRVAKDSKQVPMFINRDPRGYSLKIDDEYCREHKLNIHQDWGGYGIIAPDFTPND